MNVEIMKLSILIRGQAVQLPTCHVMSRTFYELVGQKLCQRYVSLTLKKLCSGSP
jgi:hypothetical protein